MTAQPSTLVPVAEGGHITVTHDVAGKWLTITVPSAGACRATSRIWLAPDEAERLAGALTDG